MAIRKMLSSEEKLYVHYSYPHFDKDRFKKAENSNYGIKPIYGLWGSPVETVNSWKNWCIENEFAKCRDDNCFYFRIRGWQVYEIETKDDLKALPCRLLPENYGRVYPEAVNLDFELIQKDRYSYSALDINIKEVAEYLPGYDCDSLIVLDDRDLVINYDAKFTDKPVTLGQLVPMKWYKTIHNNIELSILRKMQENKQYVYCEQADSYYGFKTIVACITDGRIVETCGYTETEAKEIIAEILKYKLEIRCFISDNRIDG